jgi:hypothetical protein
MLAEAVLTLNALPDTEPKPLTEAAPANIPMLTAFVWAVAVIDESALNMQVSAAVQTALSRLNVRESKEPNPSIVSIVQGPQSPNADVESPTA